jgi:WD40 repeat protein
MGSIITKENAAQIELLGSIKENLTESLIGSHLAWSPDGKEIALTTNGDGVRIIDPLTMKEVGEIKQNVQGLIDRPSDVAYSPDGKTIAIAIPTGIFSYPNNVAFYDVITHKTVQKTIHWSGINIINYSHNGRWFTYGSDGTIFVINLQNIQGKELMRYDSDDESRFNYAIFSPNDKYFAFAGMDFPVQIYDTSSWNSVYKYDGGGGGLCFSPDNKYFVNGKGIWSMDNINIVKEFGRELYINVCDYGINGDIIINGEAPIQILDAKTGEVLNLLKGDKDIFDIALSPDGRFIASLGSDKYDSIKLWGIPV